jgi:hypothetical protein
MSCRPIMKAAVLVIAVGFAAPALAGEARVTVGPPTPILLPPPEFIPAPITPPNGAPAPTITPLPPLVIYTAPVVVVPVPSRGQAARK